MKFCSFYIPEWNSHVNRNFFIPGQVSSQDEISSRLHVNALLVIPDQTSVQAGDMILLSWREWWDDITELGWLTLCSPPQAESGCMLEDFSYWGDGCEFLLFNVNLIDLFLAEHYKSDFSNYADDTLPITVGVHFLKLYQTWR